MNIVDVTDATLPLYLELVQHYEREFSAITNKLPNEHGLYALDTTLGGKNAGFLLNVDRAPAGLAAVKTTGIRRYEICEFYIVPAFRMKSLGKKFAHHLLRRFAGCWEVKQISGAEYATQFWRRVIDDFTSGDYVEDIYIDPYWGKVVRQAFRTPNT